MSSREIGRRENEYRVVSWFRGDLLGDQTGICRHGKESGSKTCVWKMTGRRGP